MPVCDPHTQRDGLSQLTGRLPGGVKFTTPKCSSGYGHRGALHARPRRSFASGASYHVTLRCNNQAFDLRRPQARKTLMFCLARAQARFGFRLHGLCIMSNHVHYLIRLAVPR